MPLVSKVFALTVFVVANLSPPATTQLDLAQIMVKRAMDKIITPSNRRNIRIDVGTITEKYDASGHKKSEKIEHKTTDGRMEIRGINIDELYRAFETRYNFYIDANESTASINNITCARIKFKSKPNLAVKKTIDQFINRTEGSIYINLDDLNIVKIEGLIKNAFYFNFSWYFIPIARIDIYQFEFSVEYILFENILVENSINGSVDYKIIRRGVEKFTNKITNHRMR